MQQERKIKIVDPLERKENVWLKRHAQRGNWDWRNNPERVPVILVTDPVNNWSSEPIGHAVLGPVATDKEGVRTVNIYFEVSDLGPIMFGNIKVNDLASGYIPKLSEGNSLEPAYMISFAGYMDSFNKKWNI